jgi:hypothetical protein
MRRGSAFDRLFFVICKSTFYYFQLKGQTVDCCIQKRIRGVTNVFFVFSRQGGLFIIKPCWYLMFATLMPWAFFLGADGTTWAGGQKRGPLLLFQYSLLQELSIYQSGRKVLDRLAKSVLSRGEQKICSTFFSFPYFFG